MMFWYPLQKDLDKYYKFLEYCENVRYSKVICLICKNKYNYLSFKKHFSLKHINYCMY